MSELTAREAKVDAVAKELEHRRKMQIQYDKKPKNCYLCNVEPFAHLTACDCCNHYFCIDCINKFDLLRHILLERKFISKDDKLGHVKTPNAIVGNYVYCLCNTSLRCNVEDNHGTPIHYTSEEQKVYTLFEIMNFHGKIGEKIKPDDPEEELDVKPKPKPAPSVVPADSAGVGLSP